MFLQETTYENNVNNMQLRVGRTIQGGQAGEEQTIRMASGWSRAECRRGTKKYISLVGKGRPKREARPEGVGA